MISKKKDDSKKPASAPKKQKNTRARKNNNQKTTKKRPQKNIKQNPKRHIPPKKTEKIAEQNNKVKQIPEMDFISKATLEDEWTIENIDRYVLAVRKAFEKIPENEKEEFDLREIWVNSSLPADLILKLIIDHGEKIGIKKNSLYLDGKVVY